MLYELERGKECYVGDEMCEWMNKNVLTKELEGDLPIGKRILIQNDRLTIVVDMLHSIWLALVT